MVTNHCVKVSRSRPEIPPFPPFEKGGWGGFVLDIMTFMSMGTPPAYTGLVKEQGWS